MRSGAVEANLVRLNADARLPHVDNLIARKMAGPEQSTVGEADIEFHRPVLPGDVLEHRVRVSRAVGETVIFEGECVVRGELVFTVSRMVVAYRPAEQLRAPAEGEK